MKNVYEALNKPQVSCAEERTQSVSVIEARDPASVAIEAKINKKKSIMLYHCQRVAHICGQRYGKS